MITAAPSAPEGLVSTLPAYGVADFPADAAILCRNGAPLVAFAFALLRRGSACHILGRDIAGGLERLLDKVAQGDNKNDAQIALIRYCARESDKLRKRGKAQEADNLEDRCRCLALFIDNSGPRIAGVRVTLTKLFASGPGITLATIHKAKGLEWSTVFLLDRDALMPSRWATTPEARRQEQNLLYVAVTRAKLNLYYIKSGSWK